MTTSLSFVVENIYQRHRGGGVIDLGVFYSLINLWPISSHFFRVETINWNSIDPTFSYGDPLEKSLLNDASNRKLVNRTNNYLYFFISTTESPSEKFSGSPSEKASLRQKDNWVCDNYYFSYAFAIMYYGILWPIRTAQRKGCLKTHLLLWMRYESVSWIVVLPRV